MGIGYEVGGIEQVVVGQVADGAPVLVGGKHPLTKRGLVEPLLDQAQRVVSLGHVGAIAVAMASASSPNAMRAPQLPGIPVDDEGRDDGLISGETPRK